MGRQRCTGIHGDTEGRQEDIRGCTYIAYLGIWNNNDNNNNNNSNSNSNTNSNNNNSNSNGNSNDNSTSTCFQRLGRLGGILSSKYTCGPALETSTGVFRGPCSLVSTVHS